MVSDGKGGGSSEFGRSLRRLGASDRTEALAGAAETLVVAVEQLGACLAEAHRALDDAWRRF